MRPKEEYKTTDNRTVYNRLRKEILEREGNIHCSYCGYHSNENRTSKWYGGSVHVGYKNYPNTCEYWVIRYPNWKLVSKQKKQWMVKKVKKEDSHWVRPAFDFVF